jgi:hypothetical protein
LEKGQKRKFIDTFCSNKFHKKMQSKVYLSVNNDKIHFCLHFCFKVWCIQDAGLSRVQFSLVLFKAWCIQDAGLSRAQTEP